MSYSLNSLKEVIQQIMYGSVIEVMKGDARSSDYGSYEPWTKVVVYFP